MTTFLPPPAPPALPAATLTTARTVLRPWRAEDLAPFAALNADREVMRHFPTTLDRAQSDAVAHRLAQHIEAHGYGPWALEIPGVTPFAGFVGLMNVSFDAPFAPAVEIGWRLARAWWSNGYATEAAQAAVAFAFDTLGLDTLVSFTVTANARSRAVMARLGMHHCPDEDFLHPLAPPGHRMRRHVLYRLAASDWRASTSGG
ncbi:GNAT family N-acetyltransferase [Pandoraea nosoerga]|uniref:GNAT family N-acetyltransferase n=1 Tax=Pandoraea nosoerga TaxID=2508296 RepID=UPI0019820F16|nr:GNAT family N-acetyltransferase [Pandoraea nosoerga]MBN4678112.1 GNAT family N-acetyltransferase [Pandoraea nosoerga]MBN4683350.1 GNAT family N-acetyltransferase [Pandoraea nosoerga]